MRRKAFILIALFWILIAAIFIGYKEFTLQTGTEVLLKTQPIDPRDIFRGDFVILNYEISQFDNTDGFEAGETVYVPLNIVDGYGQAQAVQREKPEGLFAKGTVSRDTFRPTIEYGIESYFVPEGTGRVLERARGGELDVLVSIDSFGNAVIKDLFLNGERVSFDAEGIVLEP